MSEYHRKEIEEVLKDHDEFFRIKITSGNHETNWMNVSPSQLKKIKMVMGK